MGLSAKERAKLELEEHQKKKEERKKKEDEETEARKKRVDDVCTKLITNLHEEIRKRAVIDDNTEVHVSIDNRLCTFSSSKTHEILDNNLGPVWDRTRDKTIKKIFDDAQNRGVMIVMIFGMTIHKMSLSLCAVNPFSAIQGTRSVSFELGHNEHRDSHGSRIYASKHILFRLWSPKIRAKDLPVYSGWNFFLGNRLPTGIECVIRKYAPPRWQWIYSSRDFEDDDGKGFYCPIKILQ